MIKTVKVKKQLRLDELIKYIYEKKLISKEFNANGESPMNVKVKVNKIGEITSYGYAAEDRFFTVEVEEEITDYTAFKNVVIIILNGIKHMRSAEYHSIRSIRCDYPTVTEIHTLINGKLQLIWEAESDERD